MFQFERSERDGVTVLTLAGNLDAATSAGLKKEVVILTDGGKTRVAVDLGKLTLIDSTGVGVLISLFKRARAAGGAVHFAGLVRAAQGDLPPLAPRSLARSAPVARRGAGQDQGMRARRRDQDGVARRRRRRARGPALLARCAVPGRARPVQPRRPRRHAHLAAARQDLARAGRPRRLRSQQRQRHVRQRRAGQAAEAVARTTSCASARSPSVRVGRRSSDTGPLKVGKFLEVHTQVGAEPPSKIIDSLDASLATNPGVAHDLAELEDADRKLRTLYAFMQSIATTLEQGELFERILRNLLDAVPRRPSGRGLSARRRRRG